ncbi:MAG: trehalose-6-phosphate synthase [Candidatus Devosia euplotis]|nr:trehalose-6-phosphate synthase [Candidatus Devosia euplotis]
MRKTLAEREGFWFGWSGKLAYAPSSQARFEDIDGLSIAQIDLTCSDHHAYYAGFSNSILRPSFQLRLDLATIEGHWHEGYRAVNRQFARALLPQLKPDDIIWVHDYHMIPLASELRNLDARNRVGFCLYIPFPAPDALYAIPHHNELMRDLSCYDLVDMQANRDVAAFTEFADHQSPSSISGNPLRSVDFSRSETGVFPIGSDPDAFARLAASPAATKMIKRVERLLP